MDISTEIEFWNQIIEAACELSVWDDVRKASNEIDKIVWDSI